MGYCTTFELSIIAGDDVLSTTEFYDYFEKVTSYHCEELYHIKWYDHVSDMCTISTKYPRTVFSLWFKGEDNEDIGCYYFHNGKCTGGVAKLVYPSFSHSDFTFASDYPELLV